MKTNIISALLLSGMLILLSSCSSGDVKQDVTTERTVAVKTQVIAPVNRQITKTFTGSLQGEKQAVLYSKISEAVESVNVIEGEQVSTDKILIALDRTGPSSQVQQSQSVFLNSEKNYRKMEFLYKEGAVSESQFDASRTEYEVAKASFEAAEQLINIKSPISGEVTSVDVSEGDFVQLGQKLATVATTGILKVKFGVNAGDVRLFKVGSEVYITGEDSAEKASGRVTAIAGSANPVTRTFEVEAEIANPDHAFKPGMFVRINFVVNSLGGITVIPRRAIVTLDGADVVFVVKDGKAVQRQLVIGTAIGDEVMINSGLAFGDTLVTLGQDYLEEGIGVRVTEVVEAN